MFLSCTMFVLHPTLPAPGAVASTNDENFLNAAYFTTRRIKISTNCCCQGRNSGRNDGAHENDDNGSQSYEPMAGSCGEMIETLPFWTAV